MIPNTFDYVKAASISDAIHLLKESNGEGKLIAGGHSLIPLMKFRLSTPETLIDISHLKELKGVKKEGNRLIVGALTTHAELCSDPIASKELPILIETVKQIGDMQVRNKGTIGGNIAHADPAADLPAVALALNAIIHLTGENGEEEIPIQDFLLGPFITSMPETSIITAISFSIPPVNSKSIYLKYYHPASGYAVVGVCAIARKNKDDIIDTIRVGITGAGEYAYRAQSVENDLFGKKATPEVIHNAAKLASKDGEMGEDLFASSDYRKELCTVYTERALKKLLL